MLALPAEAFSDGMLDGTSAMSDELLVTSLEVM
jgi:hypothetical protein